MNKKTIICVLSVLLFIFAQNIKAESTIVISVNDNSIQSDNAAHIYWNTNLEAYCGIDYSVNPDLSNGIGTNGSLIQRGLPTNDGKFYYVVHLSDLKPNTDYYYRVNCIRGGDILSTQSEIKKLKATVSNNNGVTSISLSSSGSTVNWTVNGYSAQGYKVVWSKTTSPTYPCRSGDQYHYFASSNASSDTLTAFDGSGIYYVRVCEYLGSACGIYSNEIQVQLSGTVTKASCKETDNGIDYFNKGIVYTTDESSSGSYNDICFNGGNVLTEWYCDGSTVKSKQYTCPFGCTDGACKATGQQVAAINLYTDGQSVKWTVDGNSAQGFKVVWSKNEHPTYPTRDGDQYHYFSDPKAVNDILTAFAGAGIYYVRVCEYLGSSCGVYSNEVKLSLDSATNIACTLDYNPVCGKDGKTYGNKCTAVAAGIIIAYSGECKSGDMIVKINDQADKLSNNQLDQILTELKELRNLVKEQQNEIKYLRKFMDDMNKITAIMQGAINQFITYGTDASTKKLGEGERAAVISSYKAAYGNLPSNNDELADAIKIANGRWPSEISTDAESKAKVIFKKIYNREADMNNANDSAAVTVMAYGLRQRAENRNLASEKKGIEIFNDIFGHVPQTTEEWNAMQAITYSGAKR